jgi:hypothetical protein
MLIKDMDDTTLYKTAENMLNEIENRLIAKQSEMNNAEGISDDDFYFLNDMLRLTRSYGNLIPEILKIGTESKSS